MATQKPERTSPMTIRMILSCGIGMLPLLIPFAALGDVELSVDGAGGAIVRHFVAGDVVPVTMSVCSREDAAVLGVELGLGCKDDSIRIRDVEVNPVFGTPLGNASLSLPAQRCRLVRVQTPGSFDPNAGSGDAPEWLARVEVEIMEDGPFRSALTYWGRGVAAGRRPRDAASPRENSGTIAIINRPRNPWSVESEVVVVEVQPLGGGAPLGVLAPDTTYELHYAANVGQIHDYMAYAGSTDDTVGIVGGSAPPQGYWSDKGLWYHDAGPGESLGLPDDETGVFPNGYLRRQAITSELDSYAPNGSAGHRGHLFNFTTGSQPGDIGLELHFFWNDRAAKRIIEMDTLEVLTIGNTLTPNQ